MIKLRALPLLVVAAASLAASAALAPSIDAQKSAALGPVAPAPPPPEVAVPTVLLGAFRGLVVDYLWLRATRLEEEGKFYEAKELAAWISDLEPRLEQVWSFQAHGLAYNLSAACDDPRERWRWIQAGIELLRDSGIPKNPCAPELYFMLSRIYSDKIGGPFDDYHLFLKRYLALDLVKAFGPLGSDPELEALAAAPRTLDADAKALLARLRAAGLDLGATDGAWDEALFHAPDAAALAKQADPETLRRLRAHFRAAWARRLGLDPSRCLEIERRYGPLDWRGCDALSLYWAAEGVRAAEKLGPARKAREERRLERLAIGSLKHAVRRGRLVLEPGGDVFFAPEPRLVARVIQLYDQAIERARDAERAGEKLPDESADDEDDDEHERPPSDLGAALYRSSLESARGEFLVEAVSILSRYGKEAEARRTFALLAKTKPELRGTSYGAFVNEMLDFEVRREGATQVTSYQILLGNWTRAWLALARGDDEEAMGRIALADRVHREWKKKVAEYRAQGDEKAEQRLGTVNLAEIKKEALAEARARLARSPALLKRLEERAGAFGKREGEK